MKDILKPLKGGGKRLISSRPGLLRNKSYNPIDIWLRRTLSYI